MHVALFGFALDERTRHSQLGQLILDPGQSFQAGHGEGNASVRDARVSGVDSNQLAAFGFGLVSDGWDSDAGSDLNDCQTLIFN